MGGTFRVTPDGRGSHEGRPVSDRRWKREERRTGRGQATPLLVGTTEDVGPPRRVPGAHGGGWRPRHVTERVAQVREVLAERVVVSTPEGPNACVASPAAPLPATATANFSHGGTDRPSRRREPRGGVRLMDRLLSVKEAAQVLACSEAAVRKWLRQGRLPRVKVGRLTRVRARDVEATVRGGLDA